MDSHMIPFQEKVELPASNFKKQTLNENSWIYYQKQKQLRHMINLKWDFMH